jgi:DNA repair exonuclease SbcCD ATPase subunit
MKIKEYLITRYGPLKNKGPFQLKDFNLFWGKNEEGKTLTIDALVKLLLGRNTRDFERIDRVEENPEGYVIILDDKGKEVKLPEKGDLTKVVDLTSSECCNIFIVRNSNLSVARDVAQESEFYTNVTDHLTGLRTKEISKLKEILREIAKITPEGTFRNIKDEKLKTRIGDANFLERKINDLVKEMKEKGFDKLEEEAARQREEIKRITQKIGSFEDARKREKYEKGKEALGELKKLLEELKDLEIYNQDDEQLWRDCEKEVKNYTEQKEKLHTELKENEEKRHEIIEKLSEVERDFMVFNDRKKILDNEIKPELNEYVRKSENLAQQERKSKFFSLVGIISAILLGISLLGVIFSSSFLFYILVVLFSISAVISVIFKFQFVRDKAWLAGAFERIKLTISKFGLDSEDIEGIIFNIQRFDEEYEKKQNELQQIQKEKGILDEKIMELRDKRIADIENKIKDANEKMDRIKAKSKEGSLKEYIEKFKLKQEVERSIEEQNIILKNTFGEKSKELKENIPYWEEEIGNLEKYKDKAKDLKYSETAVSELEKEKQVFEDKLKEINNRMLFFQEEMEEVERKANEILQPYVNEYLYCKTTVDLEAIKDKLQGFIKENESNKDNVLKVIEIFEEIEAEEKEKVSELFGKNSPISKYFNEITGGLYKEVIFNQGKIEVIHSDGTILGADKLSGGSYDQLYFSIRLALGEKLLKDKKGFFIMDDPFVKADPYRLQRQVEMLKKISKLGWQVIYFSAKGEIKDAFKGDIDRGTINYVEL